MAAATGGRRDVSVSNPGISLAEREHGNLVEAFTWISSHAPGAVERRDAGLTALLSGLPAWLFNQILVDGDPDRVTREALEAAVGLARSRPAPWAVNLREGPDDAVASLAEEIGLHRVSPEPWVPGMALDNAADAVRRAPAVPDGLVLVRAADQRTIDDHVQVAAEVFEMPAPLVLVVLGEASWLDPAIAVYTGYHDGVPVAAGLGFRTGATIGIYNIATIASARRRGFGEAVTWRVIADGVAAGCDAAVLQASEMGMPVYERMGFRHVVGYTGWVDSGFVSDASAH
jgi:hypothetical protein